LPRFAADGARLAYETYGVGAPVVLLHGFTSLGSTWRRNGWTDALVAAGFRAVTLDFPAHGASDAPAEDDAYTTPRLAAAVVALLDELALERAALVGFSMGGGVALQVALDAPQRVSRVVVGGVGDAALHELDPDVLAANERIRRNAELAGNDFDALRPYLRHGCWPGGLAALHPLQLPVLLVVAGHDEYMRPTGELVQRLEPTRVLEAPDRGHHDVLLDEDVRRAVVDFLRESG
jgi:pimeloyl-ACP methyl ester carboxylesterase